MAKKSKSTKKGKSKKTYSIQKRKNFTTNKIYSFKQKTYFKNEFEVEMDGNDAPFTLTFSLLDLVQYQEFQKLFDMYKIKAVGVEIVPRQPQMIYQTASGADTGGSAPVPNVDAGGTHLAGTSSYGLSEILSAIDYNDTTTPADYQEVIQYADCKITRDGKIHRRYLKPKMVIDPTSTALNMNGWLPTDKYNVPHYGIRGIIANVPNISINGSSDHPVMWYDVILTYYIDFKVTK